MLNKKKFTLIEVMIASIVTVLAMLAIVGAISTTSQQTSQNSNSLNEELLITGAYEKTVGMTYAQVNTWLNSKLELSNDNNNGPIIGDGSIINNLPNWKQVLQKKYLDPNNLTLESATPTDYLEVTIQILYNNELKKEIKCHVIN